MNFEAYLNSKNTQSKKLNESKQDKLKIIRFNEQYSKQLLQDMLEEDGREEYFDDYWPEFKEGSKQIINANNAYVELLKHIKNFEHELTKLEKVTMEGMLDGTSCYPDYFEEVTDKLDNFTEHGILWGMRRYGYY